MENKSNVMVMTSDVKNYRNALNLASIALMIVSVLTAVNTLSTLSGNPKFYICSFATSFVLALNDMLPVAFGMITMLVVCLFISRKTAFAAALPALMMAADLFVKYRIYTDPFMKILFGRIGLLVTADIVLHAFAVVWFIVAIVAEIKLRRLCSQAGVSFAETLKKKK